MCSKTDIIQWKEFLKKIQTIFGIKNWLWMSIFHYFRPHCAISALRISKNHFETFDFFVKMKLVSTVWVSISLSKSCYSRIFSFWMEENNCCRCFGSLSLTNIMGCCAKVSPFYIFSSTSTIFQVFQDRKFDVPKKVVWSRPKN